MKNNNFKALSSLMLLSNGISTLFYSMSYPYIYAKLVQVVPHLYIGLEQILACLGTIIFCRLWNCYSDRLFSHFQLILWLEIICDVYLFVDVLIRNNLKFYFLLNVVIFSVITRNLCCARTKMRAKVHPTENLRERYDNNVNVVCSTATLIGSFVAIVVMISLRVLFILAFVGNVIDNIFDLYIYRKLMNFKEVQ